LKSFNGGGWLNTSWDASWSWGRIGGISVCRSLKEDSQLPAQPLRPVYIEQEKLIVPPSRKTEAASTTASDGVNGADRMNAECLCITLDPTKLTALLDLVVGRAGFGEDLLKAQPHLFANPPVFIDLQTLDAMMEVVGVIEKIARSPRYASAVMGWAPTNAVPDFGVRGAFMGYDFHLTADGPQLIEINTNAGGAFLNAVLAETQMQCCQTSHPAMMAGGQSTAFRESIIAMFEKEWRAQGREDKLKSIVIVDEEPEAQPLYSEFLAAKSLLEEAGYDTIIAGPEQLILTPDGLYHGKRKIDLVYNRLVDFGLELPASETLREAYLTDRVVLTPNPHIHALFADKRNFCLLTDEDWLAQSDLDKRDTERLLAAVPRTRRVDADNADRFWSERRKWFFKPARSHGSKGVYRGAKLTKKVWQQIVAGDYVAQLFTPPSVRKVRLNGQAVDLKVDVRLYTYGGQILMTAARLYQGQATNMRTPGGGFAPVLSLADIAIDGGEPAAGSKL